VRQAQYNLGGSMHLTKMALSPYLLDINAEDTGSHLPSQVFAKHGHSTDIVSDRGSTLSQGFGDNSASYSVSRPISRQPTTQRLTDRLNSQPVDLLQL